MDVGISGVVKVTRILGFVGSKIYGLRYTRFLAPRSLMTLNST